MRYQDNIKHSRRKRYYDRGETTARYGIARELADGSYEFLTDWGHWNKDYALIWSDPPDHYFIVKGRKRPGTFIVNFNKPSSPQPLKGYLR